MRSGTRGRPALLWRPTTMGASPSRSKSGVANPLRALRMKRCGSEASICCQACEKTKQPVGGAGRSYGHTAAKEVISGGAGKHGQNSQKIARKGYRIGRNYTAKTRNYSIKSKSYEYFRGDELWGCGKARKNQGSTPQCELAHRHDTGQALGETTGWPSEGTAPTW